MSLETAKVYAEAMLLNWEQGIPNHSTPNRVDALRTLLAAVEDTHCATCQCDGTVCNVETWCKRTWRHDGLCSNTRDEGF